MKKPYSIAINFAWLITYSRVGFICPEKLNNNERR
jgi:hypothetical protein